MADGGCWNFRFEITSNPKPLLAAGKPEGLNVDEQRLVMNP